MLKKFNITVNGNSYEVTAEEIKDNITQQSEPVQRVQTQNREKSTPQASPVQKSSPSRRAASGGTVIKAPMPGTINDIKVKEGEKVSKGNVLLILEAMKMENEILAPEDGTIASVNISKGASVNTGDVLITFR